MAVATSADAAAFLGRPLTTDEAAQVQMYLNAAEAEILRKLPTALTQAADPLQAAFKTRLISVECTVALRAARLPQGIDLVTPETGNTDFAPSTQVGFVQLMRREWRQLGVRNAGAVALTPGESSAEINASVYSPGDRDSWEQYPWSGGSNG